MTHNEPSQLPFTAGDTEQLKKVTSVELKSTHIENINQAMETLQAKLRSVTKELAEGQINQAQFQTIYSRYRERLEIIQRLKERSPDSDAWQRVTSHEGITNILRKQHEAEIEGAVILLNDGKRFVKKYGNVELDREFGRSVLANVSGTPTVQSACTQIDDGRWINLISGPESTSIFFFSREPSVNLKEQSKIVHEEFERLNEEPLKDGDTTADALEFPHEYILPR